MQPEWRRLVFILIESTGDNMNFVVIPFLLAVRITGDEDRWKNGPEYTFNVRTSMIANLTEDEGKYRGTSLINRLKCRAVEPADLLCHFEDSKFTRLNPHEFNVNSTIPEESAVYSTFGFGNGLFQIKFNERGIDGYEFVNIDRSSPDYLVNMYRMIGNQLSVGAKIRGENEFAALETFTVGECLADYKISRRKSEVSGMKGEFELASLSGISIDDQTVEIVRERRLDKCLPHPVYFFGTRYVYGIIHRDTIEKIESSTTRMNLSKSSFHAETVNIVKIYSPDRKLIGEVLDHIYITLESIDPADSPAESILNSVPASVIVDKLHDKCL